MQDNNQPCNNRYEAQMSMEDVLKCALEIPEPGFYDDDRLNTSQDYEDFDSIGEIDPQNFVFEVGEIDQDYDSDEGFPQTVNAFVKINRFDGKPLTVCKMEAALFNENPGVAALEGHSQELADLLLVLYKLGGRPNISLLDMMLSYETLENLLYKANVDIEYLSRVLIIERLEILHPRFQGMGIGLKLMERVFTSLGLRDGSLVFLQSFPIQFEYMNSNEEYQEMREKRWGKLAQIEKFEVACAKLMNHYRAFGFRRIGDSHFMYRDLTYAISN